MASLVGKILTRGALALGIGGTAFVAGDEGTQRSLKFWRGVMPVYITYRLKQRELREVPDEIADEEWARIHDYYAPQIMDLTLELKGFYLKQAQLLSTRDEFVPPQYMKRMKCLQDDVPTPFEPGQAEAVVESSLGRPLSDVFSEFESVPIGSASIGQVHRAQLRETNELVAVKVQYPGIERKFRADMETTLRFCRLAMPQHVPAMKEIRKQFMTEFDYQAEAADQEVIRRNIIEEGPFGDRVRVPKVYPDLCTKNVLVMEYLPGKTLVTALREQLRVFAELQGKTAAQLEAERERAIKTGKLNFHSLAEERTRTKAIGLWLVATDWVKNAVRLMHNLTVGLVTGNRWTIRWTPPPIDLSSILQLISDVHAYEIFVNGVFNGDSHPGNILLCDDGRIGLIDYGQVKYIAEEERFAYANVIVALADDDREKVVRSFYDMGCHTKYNDPDICYRLAAFWNDRDTDDVTGGRNISTFMDWCQAQDPVEDHDLFPQWAVMPARTSVLLRGMAMAFGIRMRTAPLWRPYAQHCIIEYNQKKKELELVQ